MFGARGRTWLRSFSQLHQRPRFLQTTSFCSDPKNNTPSSLGNSSSSAKKENDVVSVDERYKMLENMDMMTAAKILFTDPPKKKKFGLDFHLVQLFFACLPSLAVYLVAQYARYEMRRMEVEVEQKKKQREEEEAKEKEKELELNPPKEKEAKPDPEIVEVKVRLEKLEEAVKEIVVESKKQSDRTLVKTQVSDDEKKTLKSSSPGDKSSSSRSNEAVGKDQLDEPSSPKSKAESSEDNKSSEATLNSSPRDQKGQSRLN